MPRKLTNPTNLPEPFLRALAKKLDYRPSSDRDFYVTGLIAPAQQMRLKELYDTDIAEPANKMLWALLGDALHKILEDALSASGTCWVCGGEKTYFEPELDREMPCKQCHGTGTFEPTERYVGEQRLVGKIEVDGTEYTISARFDLYDTELKILADYKMTSVWAMAKGTKADWVAQLSLNAWIMRQNGMRVDVGEIVAMLRDWSPSWAAQNPDLDRGQIASLAQELWTDPECEEYVRGRIRAHVAVQGQAADDLPECSEEERWYQGTTFQVFKKGNKRATKNFEEKEFGEKAHELARKRCAEEQGKNPKAEFEVVEKRGTSNRCEPDKDGHAYCPVWRWCRQYKREADARVAAVAG